MDYDAVAEERKYSEILRGHPTRSEDKVEAGKHTILVFFDYTTSPRLQALDTAQGLAYLHRLSPPVCHGDIKGVGALRRADLTLT